MDSKDSDFSFQSKSGVSNVNFDPSSDPLDPTAKNTHSNPHSSSTLDPSANASSNSKSDESPNFNISSFANNNSNCSTLSPKLSKTGFFNGNSSFFNSINKPTNFNANRRTSVSAEALNPDTFGSDNWKPPVHQLSNIQLQRLNASVIKNFLFSQLDEESLKTIIFALEEKRVPKDTEIIKQGDEGDFFYVVEKGTVDYFVNNKNVNTSSDGSSFGELALMYNSPRAATVISKTDCILWALDRMTFRRILLEGTAKKRSLYENFLKEVPVLQSLSSYERSKLADALNTESYTVGQNIVTEGEAGENFYFIEDGTAEVLKSDDDDHDKVHVITILKKGDYFGELALLYDSPRQATVRATSPLKVVTLNKSGFQRLLGPAVDILKIQDPTKGE